MTEGEAIEIAYQAFKDGIAASAVPGIAIAYDGIPFAPVAGVEHLVLSVRHPGTSVQDTLGQPGNRRFERVALVMVEVVAVGGLGSARYRVLAKIVADIFEGRDVSDVDFLVAQSVEAGDDGQWFRGLVSVPLRYYETR